MEAKVQEWLDEPLGHLSRPLYPEDKVKMALEGSGIADLINRIQLDVSGAQLSIVGLANDIVGFNACVTTRDIIATYPFPNTLVVCRITGEKLRAAMERAAEYFEIDENGKVVVAKSFLLRRSSIIIMITLQVLRGRSTRGTDGKTYSESVLPGKASAA